LSDFIQTIKDCYQPGIHSGNSKTFGVTIFQLQFPFSWPPMGSAAILLDGASRIVATLKILETNYVVQVRHDYNERCQKCFDCIHLRLPSMHPDFQLFCHLWHNAKGGGRGVLVLCFPYVVDIF
jgi:hypothetical protein